MKQTTLTTWLVKLPVRFALISMGLILLLSLLYPAIGGLFYPADALPFTPVLVFIGLGILVGAYLTIRKAPAIQMDNTSFITIHTAQTMLLFLLFSVSTYLFISHQQYILYQALLLNAKFSGTTTILISLIATYFMYILGIEIFNIYVKFRCMQRFNIPTWKIILSIPFGFSALWVPGYLLNTKQIKNPSQKINSKWYNRIINWTTSNQLNTISMFVFITIISSFFAGLNAMLLTFIFALIFGIWVLQIGAKTFEKNIAKKYSSVAIITNIALIIIFSCFYIFAPQPSQNIQISVSDTEITSTPGQ